MTKLILWDIERNAEPETCGAGTCDQCGNEAPERYKASDPDCPDDLCVCIDCGAMYGIDYHPEDDIREANQ